VEIKGSVIVRDSLLESDPQLVGKFVRATLKGAMYLKDNRLGSVAIHARVLKVNENVAGRIYDLARPGVTDDGTITEEVQKKAIEQIAERADVKELPPLKKVFDFAFTRKAYADVQASGWKASQ
jgi:ABC-type nitrate/sulfonate/bicarbonate transport system substrate-binding protein